jgi:hypothetical protein
MKLIKRWLIAAAAVVALVAIPIQTASAFWWGPSPGVGPWRHSYVHDPAYRWGSSVSRNYIRDLYLYGPVYANWRQHRRFRYWW